MVTLKNLNPRSASLWITCAESHTTNSIRQTYSYGRTDGIFAVTLGDGSTTSTLPLQASPVGFQFIDGYYLSTSLNMLNEWTILFTFNYNGANDEYIAGFSTGGGINVKNSGQSGNITYYDGTTTISSGFSISRKIPYHVAISKSASNVVKIYVNGTLKATGTGTVNNITLTRIGCSKDNTNYYNGILYDFVVFKAELSVGQISKLKNRMARDRISAVPLASFAEYVEKFSGIWIDSNFTGALTLNTQPVPDDWNMETAGTARWSGTGGITLAKDTDVPTGGGSQSLKMTASGFYYGKANQTNKQITGNAYYATAWVKTDIGQTANLQCATSGIFFTANTGGVWQYKTGEATAPGGDFTCQHNGNSGSVWFDSLTLSNLSVTAINPRFISSIFSGLTLSQGTAANMPWRGTTLLNSRYPVQYSGTDIISGTMNLAAYSGVSVVCVLRDSSTTVRVVMEHGTNATTTTGWGLYVNDTGAGLVNICVRGSTGTQCMYKFAQDLSTACVLSFSLDAATGAATARINGVNQSLTQYLGTTTSGTFANTSLNIGARSGGSVAWDGEMWDVFIAPKLMTEAEFTIIERQIGAANGIIVA